jgi:putative tryptophan/tyrosine transport system substrate-binding protein
MKRREFVIGVTGASVLSLLSTTPHSLGAKVAKIGVLWHAGNEQEEAPYLGALRQGFGDFEYVEPKNMVLENRFAAEHYDRFDGLARELVDTKVDVMIAVTPPAAIAAQRATTSIPIVFVLVADPVATKLVESLAHPGGNITGISQLALDLSAKRIQLLKEAVPRVSRVALLVNPGDPGMANRSFEETRVAARPLNVVVEPVEARTPRDLDQALSLVADKFDGLVLTSDPMFFNERARIAEWAKTHQCPTMMFTAEMAKVGGLMSYSADIPALFRRAAALTVKIVQGVKPADLPVELPTKFVLALNLNTSKSLGLTFPDKLLSTADEVVE